MLEEKQLIDEAAIDEASASLTAVLVDHLDALIGTDSLPIYCHLLNGWGNAIYRDARILEGLSLFAHRDSRGAPFILQHDPEGDLHPWQSFAYAIMAGVDPDQKIHSLGTTLRHLAMRSRRISTDEGRELGHLLFAIAHLENERELTFRIKGRPRTIHELVESAIEAHVYGTFDVCRKFHLTEGLCAVTALSKPFRSRRSLVQTFLDGQLDMLLVLGAVVAEAEEFGAGRSNEELLGELRDALLLGPFIENHYYYAGHLMSLGVLAWRLGFCVRREHWAAMIFIARLLNTVMPQYLPKLTVAECFLHLGHYRRGITLLREARRGRRSAMTRRALAEYTVNFDRLPVGTPPYLGHRLGCRDAYDVALFPTLAPTRVPEVARLYAQQASAEMEPRGGFGHFRRIRPYHWPRAVHYEFLACEAGGIGVEIHVEDARVRRVAKSLTRVLPTVQARFPNRRADWDREWYGVGRARVVYPDGTRMEEIVDGMVQLIAATSSVVDHALRTTKRRASPATGPA